MTEIRDYNGRPSIWIDGKPYTAPIAFIRSREKVDGKTQIFFDKDYFKALGEAGIKAYFISCNTLWLQPDALEVFDAEVKMLLEAVPDAYIIPRFGLHPPNEWIEANPDECVLYSDGTSLEADLFTESVINTATFAAVSVLFKNQALRKSSSSASWRSTDSGAVPPSEVRVRAHCSRSMSANRSCSNRSLCSR